MAILSNVLWAGTVRSLPLREQLSVAAQLGCEELSITPFNYTTWLSQGISTKDMLAMANDANVRLAHLDPYARWVKNWRVNNLDPVRFPAGFRGFAEDDFFRIAEALGITSMSAIVSCAAGEVTEDEMVEGFGRTCRRAAQMGIRVDLEFIPFWALPNLRSAWQLVRDAGLPDTGIVLDTWHYFRGGPDAELLESISPERISCVQLADGLKDAVGGSLVEDCLFHRQLPGDGEFPLVPLIQQLKTKGALRRVGIEIFSAAWDRLSADEMVRRCEAALMHLRVASEF